MKYSFGLDVCLTAAIWYGFGFSFMGFIIALIAGLLLSVKLATVWHHLGGVRGAVNWAITRRNDKKAV